VKAPAGRHLDGLYHPFGVLIIYFIIFYYNVIPSGLDVLEFGWNSVVIRLEFSWKDVDGGEGNSVVIIEETQCTASLPW
tara:strand:+ start:144 stop:380 length:237 start_codon:yes stop_codon:yes gene_type:complete